MTVVKFIHEFIRVYTSLIKYDNWKVTSRLLEPKCSVKFEDLLKL